MVKNHKFRLLVILAFLLVGVFALTACGGGGDDDANGGNGAAVQATPAPGDTGDANDDANDVDQAVVAPEGWQNSDWVVGTPWPDTGYRLPGTLLYGGEAVTLSLSSPPNNDPIQSNDSATSDMTNQVFEGLVAFNIHGDIIPTLSTAWRVVDDVTLEFDLRQGVYFHDGTPFDAYAVRLSIMRGIDPVEGSPAAFVLEVLEDVVVVDNYTVHVISQFPFAPMLTHLTHPIGFIVSPAALAEEVAARLANGDWEEGDLTSSALERQAWGEERGLSWANPRLVNENPIGTGVFVFDSQVSGDYTRLVANENYWGQRAYLDSLVFRVIPDPATRLALLNVGEAHHMSIAPAQIEEASSMGHLHIRGMEAMTINYVGFNFNHPALSDVRVRRAITMAVNVEEIVEFILFGQGTRATGPLHPNVQHSHARDLTPLPFDPTAARELLVEAGWGDGLSLTLFANEGNVFREQSSEIMQAQLAQIGIDIDIVIMEWGAFLEATSAGEHDLFHLGWVPLTGDADYGVYSLFHSDFFGDAGNRTFYSNPRVDYLLDAGRAESDWATRDAYYRELQELLMYEVPWIFLNHGRRVDGFNALSDVQQNLTLTPLFYRARLVQE